MVMRANAALANPAITSAALHALADEAQALRGDRARCITAWSENVLTETRDALRAAARAKSLPDLNPQPERTHVHRNAR